MDPEGQMEDIGHRKPVSAVSRETGPVGHGYTYTHMHIYIQTYTHVHIMYIYVYI